MITKYTVILSDGTSTTLGASLPAEPSSIQLRPYLMPHLHEQEPEHVNVFWKGKYVSMYVGEFSALVGLPVNEKATEIYMNNIRVHDPKAYATLNHPKIYGTAVLFNRRVRY